MIKNVLITGASRGIGKAIALKFAQENFRIFINCNHSVNALAEVKDEIDRIFAANGSSSFCEMLIGDVGNPDDVRHMFEEIHKKCSGIDILINNAGIAHLGLLCDMTDGEWSRVLNTNLSSVFYCCRQAIPPMVSKRSGKIINISSMWGTSGASCEVAYSASKSGINGFTKALAKELAPSNVQVNAIACGVIDTSMNDQLTSEERKALEEEIPAGRYGTPKEIAQMVWNIVHAPEYMTGQIIGIDGGYI